MILLFPNTDTLRLALTSSIVSAEVTLSPAVVSFDSQGRIYLEAKASLSRTTTRNLDKIGVKASQRHASDRPEEVSCWPQVLPLEKEAGTPAISNQVPVLFELSHADDLPILVTEMLRLGNDRQSFRWFTTPDEADSQRVLLRVIGPPYYTLLRALDPSAAGAKGTVRAYLERAPRLWVEVGHTHPLAQQIRVAEQQLLMLRSPRRWTYLEETPFQDVYDVLQFKLPHSPAAWTEAKTIPKMAVPLKLTGGNAADVPELWVLRDNAIEQLDTFVRDADEKLTQRLKFAVANAPGGGKIVVLRTIPSKLAPPALPLEHVLGFKPFWKLPNLFVPVGRRLHPTLRRDAVRRLLADDPDQVVWLFPGEGGAFTPESVPDGAFRLLEDWVSYVIETNQEPLAAWIESTRFDFDHFVCKEPPGPKPKPDKGDKDAVRDQGDETRGPKGPVAPKGPARGKPAGGKSTATAEYLPEPEVVRPPSEWVKRRAELVESFMAVEGGLDAAERQSLWPDLAIANARAGDSRTEAAICWLNAMWSNDPIPARWLDEWVRTEAPALAALKPTKRRAGEEPRSDELDAPQRKLANAEREKAELLREEETLSRELKVQSRECENLSQELLANSDFLRQMQKKLGELDAIRQAKLAKAKRTVAKTSEALDSGAEHELQLIEEERASLSAQTDEAERRLEERKSRSQKQQAQIYTTRSRLEGLRRRIDVSKQVVEDAKREGSTQKSKFEDEVSETGIAVSANEFDSRLEQAVRTQEDARATTALFLWLASQKPAPGWLPARLAAVQAYLERNESALPVRAVWLAAYRLSQLAGTDVLGLARVRDRLLQRLLEQGLTAERDLPMFLRVAGMKDSERLRAVHEKAMDLHQAVRRWSDHIPVNLPYIDLIFAYGLAKLGETTNARRLMEGARNVMEAPVPSTKSLKLMKMPNDELIVLFNNIKSAITTNFLYKAFKYRIDLVIAGKPQTNQLAPELLTELDEIANKAGTWKKDNDYTGNPNPMTEANFLIARMRFESRILEPYEKLHPYFENTKSTNLLLRHEVGILHASRDAIKLVDQIRKLLRNGLPGQDIKKVQFELLLEALPLSTRAGESFAVELLKVVPAALTYQPPPRSPESFKLVDNQGHLLERAIFLAAHFGHADMVRGLLDRFYELIRSKSEDDKLKLINTVAAQCLRSLKKLGMRDQSDALLARLQEELLHGGTLAQFKSKYAASPKLWATVLQTLLHLADSWTASGLRDQAEMVLEETRRKLLQPQQEKLFIPEYVNLARAYIEACSHCPSEVGLNRIMEFFQKMERNCIDNTTTSTNWFSHFHLRVVEEAIQAIISDEFTLGPAGRKWLDDDEYLVRRRIHADMKRVRANAGV